jgi:thiol-disulfide isomerase/thioredoxin
VTRYPALFVDDVLVATPNDFGFYGNEKPTEGSRYSPLKSAATHERLRADLTRMISLLIKGKKESARAVAAPSKGTPLAKLPQLTITDLDGKKLNTADLAGRVVLVEFWATWCPPCRGTLAWLGDVKKKFGSNVAIVAVAVESEEPKVRRMTQELGLPVTWTMGTPELVRQFGDIGGLPTLFLFDRNGNAVTTYFGAPPTLHAEAEAKIAKTVKSVTR